LGEGLRELGYIPDKTIIITSVWPETPSELPASAAWLVSRNPEVIVAPASPAVSALKRVTGTIPIVFATAADPVASGFVATLARPGGHITGLSQLNIELSGKRVELLHEAAAPRRAVVLSFADLDPAVDTLSTAILRETERRARVLGVELRLLKVHRVEDLAAAIGRLARKDEGLIVLPTPLAFAHAGTLADLALKQGLPAVSYTRDFAARGGLMAYGVDFDDQLRRAAGYVDRILKGTRPADLPVQQPSKFQLVINLKTAKALGLTIPPSLLARADQVIE
jgi:putative ABC transport system substrate-binding protein